MRRDQAAEDPKTVHVWVCVVQGGMNALAARADRRRARAWIEGTISRDGEWDQHSCKEVYHTDGPDTGIIELAPLPDAAALIIDES